MNSLNGIIIINKEKGFTSHDVVSVVRKTIGLKRVGHTGTLDPDATGVLPVCIGKATLASDMLTNSDKEYIATFELGIITDTLDNSGNVIEKRPVNVNEKEIADVIESFVGEIEQIPPMYSAIKVRGKKLYEYARSGQEIKRTPRKITIKNIEIIQIEGSTVTIKVFCSKGTYIRTLCSDIGEKLKCGACMTNLVRTKSSIFTLDKAVTLAEFKELSRQDKLNESIIKTDTLFMDLPKILLNQEFKTRFLNGARTTVTDKIGDYRIYDQNDSFLGLGSVVFYNGRNVLKTKKIFC